MSNPPPGKQSKKLFLLRPFKGLLSGRRGRSRSPSYQGAQSVTAQNSSAISATSAPQVNAQGTRSPSPQGAQSVTLHIASASISASPTDNATSVPQVNPQRTEYTAFLGLPTTPSDSLTKEHRMKEWGSTKGLRSENSETLPHLCSRRFVWGPRQGSLYQEGVLLGPLGDNA